MSIDEEKPTIGFFELCFDVEDLEKSLEFYEKLGFKVVKGAIEYGTCGISNGDIQFTLFTENYIEQEFGVKFIFNFRGGNVEENFKRLKNQGVVFEKNPTTWEDGSIDAKLRDPDGNLIYLDTHPSEQ